MLKGHFAGPGFREISLADWPVVVVGAVSNQEGHESVTTLQLI